MNLKSLVILGDPLPIKVTRAVTLESLNLTISSGSNVELFRYTKPILISLFLVKYIPTAPLDSPTNLSPIIKSLVFELGPSKAVSYTHLTLPTKA